MGIATEWGWNRKVRRHILRRSPDSRKMCDAIRMETMMMRVETTCFYDTWKDGMAARKRSREDRVMWVVAADCHSHLYYWLKTLRQ